MGRKCLFVFWWLLLVALPLAAQDDVPVVSDIAYDDFVEDSITASAFFDWWRVQAVEGDIMVVDMAASGGLEPLLAILDPGGDTVARTEGAANATIQLEYTVPATGIYTLVATRVGSVDGTSTGAYSLRVRRANLPSVRPNPYQDVTFRCQDFEAATAVTLTFAEDTKTDLFHRFTVYGLEGFRPVIRVNLSATPDFEDCSPDAEQTVNDTFTLPGEAPYTITSDTLDSAAQLALGGAENMGTITLTIAGRDGTPGRYVALIEGFSIERGGDRDIVEVRLGPLAAKSTRLLVYMVAKPNSRLDPFMALPDEERACDDAGRRGCEDVPSLAGASFILHDREGVTITADRQDAGLILAPGSPDPMTLVLSSRGGDTYGDYVLVLIGELPPRE